MPVNGVIKMSTMKKRVSISWSLSIWCYFSGSNQKAIVKGSTIYVNKYITPIKASQVNLYLFRGRIMYGAILSLQVGYGKSKIANCLFF